MRGPLGGAVIDDLNRAIAVVDLSHTTITGTLKSIHFLELDARIQSEFSPFAITLTERPGVDSHA